MTRKAKDMGEEKKEYSLLLLAGGKSSRMGQDKAALSYEGISFLENLLKKAERAGIKEKYLSGHETSLKGIHCVPDNYKDRGPLGGMQACMKQMDTPYCLVLPVDVPQLPVQVMEGLITAHKKLRKEGGKEIPLLLSHGGREEPLIGIYPTKMADMIEETIKEGAASVFSVLKKWGYGTCQVEMEEWQGENINTPQTYQEILKHETGN